MYEFLLMCRYNRTIILALTNSEDWFLFIVAINQALKNNEHMELSIKLLFIYMYTHISDLSLKSVNAYFCLKQISKYTYSFQIQKKPNWHYFNFFNFIMNIRSIHTVINLERIVHVYLLISFHEIENLNISLEISTVYCLSLLICNNFCLG